MLYLLTYLLTYWTVDTTYQFLTLIHTCDCVSIMGGPEAPRDWQGDLNFTYRIGPSFNQFHDNW